MKIIRVLLSVSLLVSFVPGGFSAITEEEEELIVASLEAMASDPSDSPEQVVKNAVFRCGHDLESQAELLARIAWPTVERDPRLAAEARRTIIKYGGNGMQAMKDSLRRADREYSADIIKAMNEAYERVTSGIPVAYMPAMIEAIWSGTPEARILAMKTMAHHGDSGALLPIIDSAIEYPEIAPVAIECLGRIMNQRARFYLKDVLYGDDLELREAAAQALANIRGEAHAVLAEALKSDDPALRKTAAMAIIPVAGPSELSAMHEYVYRYPEDDPETVEAVRSAAEALEKAIEEYNKLQQAQEDSE